MNIIKERRKQGAICARCRSPDYRLMPEDPDLPYSKGFKPHFKCGSCDNEWCYGRDGGKYMELVER